MLARWMLTSVAVLGLSAPMWADDADDGPGRGVARISVINGDVSVRRGDSGDYVAAAINAPLVVQDRILTGAGSRGEVQFDWANMLRLSANAEVRLAELEHRRYLVQVARGTVTWRVLRDQEAYVEISTPSVSVRPVKRGTYRVTVAEDGAAEITVRSGEAEIFTPRGSERLTSGRTMLARGTASEPEFRYVAEIADDDWDRWNQSRDRDLERSRSYTYVSRDVYGAEDLDHHGRWVYTPDYGWVWSPHVAAGWAPYRYGRWSWIDWYGWSWVSYDPWGWAPYHYGRWYRHASYGWCWWPGRMHVRHYWSPGLVAFFGFGHVGVGVGWGRVGWVPLAPYETYHRWYGHRWYGGYRNRTYIDNSVTVVNNINITNTYRNSRFNNAVTVVDQDGFSRGRIGNTIRVSEAELSRASLARGPLPVAPGRESLRLADRETSVRSVERTSERFYSRHQPAQIERVSFDEQRSGIEHIARRSGGGGEVVRAGTEAANAPGRNQERVERAQPAARTDEQRGWRRADSPPSSEARGSATGGASAGDNGWRRFGSARVGESSAESPVRSERFGRPATPSTEERHTESRGSSSGDSGWTRFGSRGSSSSPNGGDSTWRRESSPRSESPRFEQNPQRSSPRSDSPRFESPRAEPRQQSPRYDSPRYDSPRYDSPRYDSPRMEQRRSEPSRSESIRISPPIVRERGGSEGGSRSAPSISRGGGDGGGGSRGSSGGGGSRGAESSGSGSSRGGGGESRGGSGRGR